MQRKAFFTVKILLNKNFHEATGTFANEKGIGKFENHEKKYVYEGELDRMVQEGWGVSFVKDKFVYKGQHMNGKFNGYSEVYNPDGTRFFGKFKNGIRHGYALSYTKDGRTSYGKYVDDFKHGPFIVSVKGVLRIEIYNYGFRYKIIEKFESSKNYFKTYYPEFEWVFKFNFKNLTDLFNEVKTDEFNKIMSPVPESENNIKIVSQQAEVLNVTAENTLSRRDAFTNEKKDKSDEDKELNVLN